ncbi:hypothetical protein ACGFIW_25855 [Micromonospora sp. NPDC048935]|uniref:hypothetical protein n=1 Tax=Micromonospora sp. NPDC048935 TaxID=3364262 RepID=UPI003719FF36
MRQAIDRDGKTVVRLFQFVVMVEELAQADDAVAGCVDDAARALAEHELIAALDAAHRVEQRLAAGSHLTSSSGEVLTSGIGGRA